MKDISKTWVLTGNSLKISDKKITKTIFSTFQKKPVDYKDPKNIN